MCAFALLGDLARLALSLIDAGLTQLLSEENSSIDPMHTAMCNNTVDTIATWSGGFIVAHDAFEIIKGGHNVVERNTIYGTDVLTIVSTRNRCEVTKSADARQ